MAIREIRIEEDEVLRKKSKAVDVINDKLLELLDDMAETMYKADGVGLAAPQVGILKRVVVIDVGDGLIKLINPVMLEQSGEQIEIEGCLSLPDVFGEVKRPEKVTVEALDIEGNNIIIHGEDLLAVALCHEIDHLDGILFKDMVIRLVDIDEVIREQKERKSRRKERAEGRKRRSE